MKGIDVKQLTWTEPYEFWELTLKLEVSFISHFQTLVDLSKQNGD